MGKLTADKHGLLLDGRRIAPRFSATEAKGHVFPAVGVAELEVDGRLQLGYLAGVTKLKGQDRVLVCTDATCSDKGRHYEIVLSPFRWEKGLLEFDCPRVDAVRSLRLLDTADAGDFAPLKRPALEALPEYVAYNLLDEEPGHPIFPLPALAIVERGDEVKRELAYFAGRGRGPSTAGSLPLWSLNPHLAFSVTARREQGELLMPVGVELYPFEERPDDPTHGELDTPMRVLEAYTGLEAEVDWEQEPVDAHRWVSHARASLAGGRYAEALRRFDRALSASQSWRYAEDVQKLRAAAAKKA